MNVHQIGIRLTACVIAMALMFGVTTHVQARQFRLINPIASPGRQIQAVPDGAVPVSRAQPVDRAQVEKLLRGALEKWNTPAMAAALSQDFYDSSRLTDAMATIVPRDAVLRVQSIQAIQTLQQYQIPDPDGGRGDLVSIVSATARTQVEYNQPGRGFVSLPGVNEYILKITTAAPPTFGE